MQTCGEFMNTHGWAALVSHVDKVAKSRGVEYAARELEQRLVPIGQATNTSFTVTAVSTIPGAHQPVNPAGLGATVTDVQQSVSSVTVGAQSTGIATHAGVNGSSASLSVYLMVGNPDKLLTEQ